ncbi:hypothetical protein ACTHSJ_33730 [Paenibacillus cellulositrophicus]|uniref:hypothetical protein n=1 Tax=Paenibacillus cellulositrophicus TaxID=562959 RepID=UPI003F7E3E84
MEEHRLNCFEISNEYIPTNGTIRVQAQVGLLTKTGFPTIEYSVNIYAGSEKVRKIILKSGGDGGISSPEANERRNRQAMMVVHIANHIAYELEDICLIKGTKIIRSCSSSLNSLSLTLPPSFIME